jgi:hypothetical protein
MGRKILDVKVRIISLSTDTKLFNIISINNFSLSEISENKYGFKKDRE